MALSEGDREAIAAEVNAHFKMLSACLPMPRDDVRRATQTFGLSIAARWGQEGVVEARRLLASGSVFGPA